MPRLADLADVLIKSRVVSKQQWEKAALACGDDLSRILEYLGKLSPVWWEGPSPAPPGLTEYQRERIQSRFDEDELTSLRRDLALNQFVLLDKLGHGGQGEVYRSRQLNPPRYAAVKVLIRDTENRRKRFEQEARAMIRIQHPAVARFYLYERIRDANSDPTDEYLIAMEYVNGTDLQRLVRQIGPIPWPFAVYWMSELLGGLAFIHRSGFIHRDVKPENVMIVGPHPGQGVSPEQTGAKLLDFGAVNRVGATLERNGGSRIFVGTMEYAAPEQWTGDIVVASDLYALAGTLFFMLTGRYAYKRDRRDPMTFMNAHLHEPAPSIQDFNPEVPQEIESLFHQMMAKNHRERGTADELREQFLKLRPREAASPPPPVPPKTAAQPNRAKALELDSPLPIKVIPSLRDRPIPYDGKNQNQSFELADIVLSYLERIFIPAHLRPPPEADVGFTERLMVMCRQPRFLIFLALVVVILIVCV